MLWLPSLCMSCGVKSVVNFSVHVMLGEVCGYLLCSCHVGWSLWLPSLFTLCKLMSWLTSLFMSCWVKSVVNISVHVMLGEVCGYLFCSCHVSWGGGYLLCACLVWWSLLLTSLFMSCWVKPVVTFSVHVMLGEVCGYLFCSCHVSWGGGYLLCACLVWWSLLLTSLFMSCWVKPVVTFSVHVM